MTIKQSEYQGVQTISVSTEMVEMHISLDFGPRICALSIAGQESLLLWPEDTKQYARQVESRDESWYLRGGHRVWLARGMADESEETYFPDNQPATYEIENNSVMVWGAIDPVNRVQRGIRVSVIDKQRFTIDNIAKNHSDMLFSAGIWALSCTLPGPGSKYYVPLGDGSSFDTATITLFKEWAGHGQKIFADDQFTVNDDCMVLHPGGKENKRMVLSAASCLALNDTQRDCAFIMATDFEPQATYPANANVAMYIGEDNFMVEMETMGALACLKPGQELCHQQRWYFQDSALSDPNRENILQLSQF